MNQSVIKALRLLDLFVEDQTEHSLSEIARKTGLSKPTAYRLLSSLEVCGFLVKVKHSDQDIRYHLGLKLLELGNVVAEQLEIRKIALPSMHKLRDEIDEVVHLVVVDGHEAVYIEKVESNQPVRLYTRVGKRFPLYVGSGPKLLLAFMPENEQNMLLQNLELKPLTTNTIIDKSTLMKDLECIRTQGFAVSNGEQDLNTVGISFPIRDFAGSVIAALAVSGLSWRLMGDRYEFVKERTRIAAEEISANLGFDTPHA
jgi:IclR family KDG regulon transcriptional repressor